MPRSTGTFSQYWDIQTTGNSSNNSQREEYIRVHLTGEVRRPEILMVLFRKNYSYHSLTQIWDQNFRFVSSVFRAERSV